MLVVSCILLIATCLSVSAARPFVKHKALSRLSEGLKGVQESSKKAQNRLAALKKRQEVLLKKIEELDGDQESITFFYAEAELAKIQFERRALNEKLQVCDLNKKCILAEIAIVSEISSEASTKGDIEFERPISGRVTSAFGVRLHPLDKVEKPHKGLDLAGDIGDSVKSTANGRVIFAGIQRGYGNIIIIQHSDEITSAYGHLSKLSVEVGDAVARGQKIGEVGMTGNSTGPHLHFEIRENGEQVNPSKYL